MRKLEGIIAPATTAFDAQGKIDLNVKTQAYTEWSYAGGLKAMEDILVAHPDINVVITPVFPCQLSVA